MEHAEFVDFYVASRSRCLRAAVAHGLSRDDAEEAVAEAYARAWASWPKVSRLQSPAAWVVRTAVNANVSWWRKRRRERPGAVTETSQFIPASYDADLVRAIGLLPPRQREVVVLRYLLDLDTESTAQWLSIAPGTVRAHLHHALASLREQLTEPQEVHR